MAPNKTTRGGISLRRRVTAWLAAILLVTMLSLDGRAFCCPHDAYGQVEK